MGCRIGGLLLSTSGGAGQAEGCCGSPYVGRGSCDVGKLLSIWTTFSKSNLPLRHIWIDKIQPSKFVIENELLYPEGCAIKYIIRHRDKGKKQDLLKAIHFIEMIIERDYK